MHLWEPGAAAAVMRPEAAELEAAEWVMAEWVMAEWVMAELATAEWVAPVRLSATPEAVASIGILATRGRRVDRTKAGAGSTLPERYPRCGGTVRRY
jgi:hypothetical protein